MDFRRTRPKAISPYGLTLAALPKRTIDATNEPYDDEIQDIMEAMEDARTAVLQ